LWQRVECTLLCNIQSRGRTHAVLVIGFYELLGNPTNLTHWATRALQSKWAWSKRYYWHLKVRFLLWPSPWNRQQIKNKNKTNNKRDDFTFPIVNFPFISRNIPASPAYGVYISQCRRYSRVCASIMIIWAVFRYWNTAFPKG
jgi:hypothetical protein